MDQKADNIIKEINNPFEDKCGDEPKENVKTDDSLPSQDLNNSVASEIDAVPQKACVFTCNSSLSLLATEYGSSEESDECSSHDDCDNDEDYNCDFTSSNLLKDELISNKRSSQDCLEKIQSEIDEVTNSREYRKQVVSEDLDSSYEDSDIEIMSQKSHNSGSCKLIENDSETEDVTKNSGGRKHDSLRVKGEMLLEDLPPIEDLHITVPENECIELGKIKSVVDQLVLVESMPNAMLIDLETVLFLEKGNKVLGKVFDVLGKVSEPMYCIRFNSYEQIQEKNIEIGQTVFVAPKTEYTQFIILSNLMRIRGSDASWKDDVEPPENCLEYSDDEEERSARRLRKESFKNQKEENGKNQENQNHVESSVIERECKDLNRRGMSRKRQFHNFERPASFNYNMNNQQFYHPSGFNYDSNRDSWHSNFNPYIQYDQQNMFQNYQQQSGYHNNNAGVPGSSQYVPQHFYNSQTPPLYGPSAPKNK